MMDIAALSVTAGQEKLQQNVGIAVAKLAMDQITNQGDALTEMMGDVTVSADPNLGANVDISV